MRLLITGCQGFVSRHFLRYADEVRLDADVVGIARSAPNAHEMYRHVRYREELLDMLDRTALGAILTRFRPTHVLHLAANSSVGLSWQKPVESFVNNTNILLNLLEQLREISPSCRVLSVGSSEEYGRVEPSDLPLTESSPLRPTSPYGVARVAQEMLSQVYVKGYDLDVVMTRSFNHIGSLQRADFVIPSLARQLIAIRDGRAPPRLTTGERTIVRDFVDVRDVVEAYFQLLHKGRTGEIYNICSGRGVTIDHVIDTMQTIAQTNAEVVTDQALIRPSENPRIVGSYEKVQRAIGWQPSIELATSLQTILQWWSDQRVNA